MSPEPKRIFVLDDDPAVRATIGQIAARTGFTATTLAGIGEFKEAYARETPSLIVLDLHLAGADGVEVLRFLAEAACKAPIVLISGMDARILQSAKSIGLGYGLNVVESVLKPFRVSSLRLIFNNLGAGTEGGAPAPAPRSMEEQINQGLLNHEFLLYYQPKVALRSRRVVGTEALIRWQHPTQGLLPPAQFLPVAESTGQIVPLTHWVLDEAVRQAAAWRADGIPGTVAVNLPTEMLNDLALPDVVDAVLARHGLPGSGLTLEVTETGVLRGAVTAQEVMTRLRLKGVTLSVDDFGTGTSSLLKLQRMPFNEIKIDRSFVKGILDNPESRIFTENVIQLARSLHMAVVAEGVEDLGALSLLAELNCECAQGFAIGRPMPAALYPSWSAEYAAQRAAAASPVRQVVAA